MVEVEFKEVGRVRSSDTTDVVVSEVMKGGKVVGYSINKYVDTDSFTGFTKGIMVPIGKVEEFLRLFKRE